MIVKNEAPVIRRCLDSVRPLIDYWVIVDTGSTDGTQQLIRDHYSDLPGELHQRPWQDFAHNRSEALTLARPHGDYTLIIDADDLLDLPAGFRLPPLSADAYLVDILDQGTRYQRPQLVANRLPWRYRGVLHEFLECPGAHPAAHLDIVMRRNHDGARRRDPQTYRNDAAILERVLAVETDPFLISRYTFYLAQSYRDCGATAAAIATYLRRAELGGWEQEVYYSLYQAARLKAARGDAPEEVIALCLRASSLVPDRAEALHCASQCCRNAGRHQQGYEIAVRGLGLPVPADGLFIEPWIYAYGLLDEYAIHAYWCGRHHDSLDVCLRLLAQPDFPADQRPRLAANARFAFARLPRAAGRGGYTPLSFAPGQHALAPARALHARGDTPRVLLAILPPMQTQLLPLYLRQIEALDYPKAAIVIYISAADNDPAREILRDWSERLRPAYAAIDTEFDAGPTSGSAAVNSEARMRNRSLRKTLDHGCDYCFSADADNLLRACTLRELVALGLPIVAPLLRAADPQSRFSNYHADIDDNGYFRECLQYDWIWTQAITGIFELPVVRGTCLIRADTIPVLSYDDGSHRHPYVVFSHAARRNGIPQYLDNRQLYGYLTEDASADAAAQLLAAGVGAVADAGSVTY